MTQAENVCSLCMCTHVKFYHLKDSIRAPNNLRFVGHTNLQAVLEKILNKKEEYRKASNEICQNCRDKLHGIYSFTRQHTELEKIFHQIADVTVRLKKLKTFVMLTDLKTKFDVTAETDKDVDFPEYSSTVADIECDDSLVSKVIVKNEFGNNFEDTDIRKRTKDLNVGLLEEAYGRSVEQQKIDSIGNANSEQITIEEEIVKEEWTMQESEIFEAKRDVLGREQTKFGCVVCNEVFSTVSCLSEHTKIVHENDSHDFKQAAAGHNNKKEEHTQRFDTMKKFACDKCDAMYKKPLKIVHSITNYSCDQCEKKFKYKYGLRVHKQSHAGVIFKCDHCNATYKSKNALQTHKKSHNGILFNCDQCDAKYKTNAGLRLHKMSHAGITFACDQCDRKYKSSESLKRHRMSHAGIKFACNQCDANLSSKKCLKNHLQRVHTDAVFSCDHCDATYKSKQAFNEHKQIHNGILFNCDQCAGKYKSSAGLRQHKMSHAGITFACNQCDAKFKYKSGLKHHKMSHAGIKFACNQCDASLSSKGNLRIHQRAVHTDAVFSCEHCDTTYKKKQSLNSHKLSQHASQKKTLS